MNSIEPKSTEAAPADRRADLRAYVARIVTDGRSALDRLNLEIGSLLAQIADARMKADAARRALDEVEAAANAKPTEARSDG